MWNQMSQWWCRKMHSKAMWPIHGRYICPDCQREYPVAWEAAAPAGESRGTRSKSNPEPADDLGRKVSWSAKVFFQRAAGLKRSDTM
jgi:hypothetical protein